MPRQPRYSLAGVPQHVIQRGNNRQVTFFSAQDSRYYRECLATAAGKHDCAIHAYVLMTNHVHLLMTPAQPDGIAKVMQSVGRRYVRYINDSYGRTGTLWEGRYKASLIDSERYLLICCRYIELNPVRAGLVGHPAAYPESSYRHHAHGEDNPLITDHPLYQALGETREQRQEAYRALFDGNINARFIKEIRVCTNQCGVLGSDGFKDGVEAMVGRHVRPGKAGRPKKTTTI